MKLPKAFTESERTIIKNKLKSEASICLKNYGVRKTTVNELVKRVNIPKGTFYLFYESKELLFFDVFIDLHNRIQGDFIKELSDFNGELSSDKLSSTLFNTFKAIDDSFMIQLIYSGDLELIMRKLPEDIVKAHQRQDDLTFSFLEKLLPSTNGKNIETFSAAFRAVFLTTLHKREIGEDVFDDMLKLLLKGICNELFMEG